MNRIAGAAIFGFMIFVVYLAIEFAFPQWINWGDFYQMMVTRLGTEQTFAIVLLGIFLVLGAVVILSFGRWTAEFAMDIVMAIKNVFAKQEAVEHQTLDNTLIIDSPRLKNPIMRLLETLFSVAIWMIFVYLFQTIATTFMWILGVDKIYFFNFSQMAIEGTVDALLLTLYTAAFFLVIIIAWSQWNYWRFGRMVRRLEKPIVLASEIAQFFSLPLLTINQIQGAKVAFIMPLPDDGLAFREQKPGE